MIKFEDAVDRDYLVTESKIEGKSRMKIVCCVSEAGVINKNKRKYPKEVLDEAVRAFQLQLKKSFSQVDHPEKKAKLKDTSHIINRLYWNEKNPNELDCEMTVLRTQAGETLREILRAGGKPGISSRGSGDSKIVKQDGKEIEIIEPGFRFDGFDFVIRPVFARAGIRKIFESVKMDEIPSTSGKTRMTLERLKKEFPRLIQEAVEQHMKEEEERTRAIKGRAKAIAGIK